MGDHGHAYNTTVKNDRYTLKRIIESQVGSWSVVEGSGCMVDG